LEFEHIHNKAIFDCFNECLSIFRPFFLGNGVPYPWSFSEKQLSVIIINEINTELLFEKIKQKILEYGSILCGLISEDDNTEELKAIKELEKLKDPNEPNYMQVLKMVEA
jgi:hypothetical protein